MRVAGHYDERLPIGPLSEAFEAREGPEWDQIELGVFLGLWFFLLTVASVVLIGFQLSKVGSKGNPSSSGRTVDRDTGAGTALLVPVPGWFGPQIAISGPRTLTPVVV